MKVNFKELSKSEGYKCLKAAVLSDCMEGQGCFNINGCDKPGRVKCFHRYCDRFRWVIGRATHYSCKTGISVAELLNTWESDRSYWYMNYYQDGNQPKLNRSDIYMLDTLDDFKKILDAKEFRCPACGGISTDPQRCDSGKITHNKVCDWKSYGLFGCLGRGTYIFIKEKAKGHTLFTPISFEKAQKGQ